MTPAELREAAEVMRRAADGEQVQYRRRGNSFAWMPATNPSWNWWNFEFRITSKPREVWLVGCAAFETKEAAQQYTSGKPRLFREVLDEQGGAAC